MQRKFQTFDQFFLHYLQQHTRPANRALHACGTAAGILIIVGALLTGHPWLALLWMPVGYGLSWAGHLVEHNKPATWTNPVWSLLADFRMLWLMLTGRLDSWLADAQQAEPGAQRAAGAAD